MSEIPDVDNDSQEIEIDSFRSEDAPGIAELFRQVYGEGYPIKTYYLPEQLIEENAAGRVISSVARTTSTGQVVGHDALVLSDPENRIYENVAGAVLPAFRRLGVFPRVFRHSLVDTADRLGVEEIVGEPLCSHTTIQKLCMQFQFEVLGLEVDLMPAAAHSSNSEAIGRVSVIVGTFRHKKDPQAVHIPRIYRDELEYLYAGLSAERTFMRSRKDLPAKEGTRGGMMLFPFAQVARIAMNTIGSDFVSVVENMEEEAREKGMEIFHLWLPLTSPCAPAAIDILHDRGYFLGAVLPNRLNGDGLLMQKLTREPNWDGIQLYSERARKIGEMVRSDWKRVTRG